MPTFTKIIYLAGKCITVGKYCLAKRRDTFVLYAVQIRLAQNFAPHEPRAKIQFTRYIFVLKAPWCFPFYNLRIFAIFRCFRQRREINQPSNNPELIISTLL